MKLNLWVFAGVALIFSLQVVCGGELWDVYSDTWVATDALGRKLPGFQKCGPPKEGKYVGIFYFLWLGQHSTTGPFDITRLLAENPANPKWGPRGDFHHWAEPELGYYLSNDEYVIRKHCYALTDAGIDTLIFDVTNALTYRPVYLRLCEVYRKIREQGQPTPQICFLVHSVPRRTVEKLYYNLYSKGLYKELWFQWKDKPLLLAPPGELDDTIKDFFTIRDCWAWTSGKDTWNWLDHYPQRYGWHKSPDEPEAISVCAAQHPTTMIGRSFHNGKQPQHDKYKLTGTEGLGLCFAEQWKRALHVDPQFVFITGWNEWVAQRFIYDGTKSHLRNYLTDRMKPGDSYFVDQYNHEYSRDIEPMKGGHTDNYYYQMIAGIRRYKGVRTNPAPSEAKTIIIDGKFSDWDDVKPEYRDTIRDTIVREHPGWGKEGPYINKTGRNDIVRSKTACDDKYIYFYVETREKLTEFSSPNWMLLFIDADQDSKSGWQGYDYAVNLQVPTPKTTTLKKNTGGCGWKTTLSLDYRVTANKMELRIPRDAIGQSNKTAFDFHWADNIQNDDDIIEFSVSGDSAPNRRFNYRYNKE